LVHVLMHTSGLCDLNEVNRRHSRAASVEAFCNSVAATVLLPAGAMKEELDSLGVDRPIPWPDRELLRLANRYAVSREVILRRMVTLDRATLDYYFQKLFQYSRLYESQRKRSRNSISGGPGPAVMGLRNMGRRYTADVIRAYGRRYIDAAELTEYLQIKIDHIPKLLELLDRGA
jgi:Zn-dependent peptidase ImmA (M78 family)